MSGTIFSEEKLYSRIMGKRILACLTILTLAVFSASGQDFGEPLRRNPNSAYMGYRVENADTVYYGSIDPIWVYPKGKGKSRDLRKYYRLVYNFNKVYPYAVVAKDIINEADSYIKANHLNKRQREKYVNQMQERLFEAYETPLRHMSFSQGQLLVKLVDREIGKSPYSIIKEYKNGIMAGFWQGVAKVFKNDLKKSYDPNGEDKMTEYLVEKWQRGEFDALYYSIFWEMPKHPKLAEVESNTK